MVEKPILYENSSVTYKNVPYGNCMESTILQFLKVLFFNPEKNDYDKELIKKIIKESEYIIISNIFDNIEKEKTKEKQKSDLPPAGDGGDLPPRR